MQSNSLVVDLPLPILEQIRQRAAESQHSVQEELVELVTAKLAADSSSVENIDDSLEGLTTLSDDELWQTARAPLAEDVNRRTAELNEKRRRQRLSAAEAEELQGLLHCYERHVLIRSKAMALLCERGHDIAPLLVPPAGA